jgi:hypothetical protein
MSRMDKSTAFFSPSFMGLYIYNSLSIIQRKKKRKKTMGRVSLEKPSFFSMGFNNSVYPFICIYDPRARVVCTFFRLCWMAVAFFASGGDESAGGYYRYFSYSLF